MTAGHDEFRDTGRLINFAGIGGPLRQTAYPIPGSCPSWFIPSSAPVLRYRRLSPRVLNASGGCHCRLRLPVCAAFRQQRPDHPRDLVGKRDGNKFVGLSGHKPGKPGRQCDATFRLLDDRRGADDQKCSESSIALLGDRPEFFLSAAGEKAWRKPEPSSEVSAAPEAVRVVNWPGLLRRSVALHRECWSDAAPPRPA